MKFVELTPFIKQVLSSRLSGKIASLDVGKKHIGVALCDESKYFVNPITTLSRSALPEVVHNLTSKKDHRMSKSSLNALSKKLQGIIDKEHVCGLVVGIPLLDGKPTPFCTEVVDLMLQLQCFMPEKYMNGDVHNIANEMIFTFWDEQYSTMEARRLVAQRTESRNVFLKQKDSMAAAVIMHKFLSFAQNKNLNN